MDVYCTGTQDAHHEHSLRWFFLLPAGCCGTCHGPIFATCQPETNQPKQKKISRPVMYLGWKLQASLVKHRKQSIHDYRFWVYLDFKWTKCGSQHTDRNILAFFPFFWYIKKQPLRQPCIARLERSCPITGRSFWGFLGARRLEDFVKMVVLPPPFQFTDVVWECVWFFVSPRGSLKKQYIHNLM